MRTLIVFLALAYSAFAAGTLNQTLQKQGQTDVVTVTVTFTGDASDGSVPFTTMLRNGRDVQSTDGYSIVGVQTKPGATQPTANWDFALQNEDGLDLLADACINRSASAVQFCATDPRPIHSAVSIRVTGNSVNSATGTVIVFLTKTTVAKRGGTGGGAVATGTYAYSGSVTTSGSPPSAVLTHSLALTDKRNFVPACYDATTLVGVGDITPIDGNSVTIKTATAATVYCTIISNGGTGGGGGSGDVTDVLAGTGIAVTNSGGPQPSVAVSLNSGSAQTCSGTQKVSAISAAGIVTCSTDQDTGGGSGVPAGGTVGQTLYNSASGTASWIDMGRALEYISDGNGTRFRVTSAAAPMPLSNTVTWNPTSISSGSRQTQTVTVTGAQQGDVCEVGIPPGVKSVGSGLTIECAFETANTATIYVENNHPSTARDPEPTTVWTVTAIKTTWAVE